MPDNLKVIPDILQQESPEMLKLINGLPEDQLLVLLIGNSDVDSVVEYAVYQLEQEMEY